MWQASLPKSLAKYCTYDEALSKHVSLQVGGPCDVMARLPSEEACAQLLQWAADSARPVWPLGGGFTTIAPDSGVRGIVVRLTGGSFEDIVFDGDRCTVGSGVTIAALERALLIMEKSGCEYLAGIPGTIGGAVVMNAGIREGAIGSAITSVRLMQPSGDCITIPHDAVAFGYRSSGVPEGIIISVELQLVAGERRDMMFTIAEYLERRQKHMPTRFPNAGSIFKNPLETEKTAGELLDACGLKGERIGGAQVTPQHANWIHTTDNATAQDVIDLVVLMRRRVYEADGIELEPELRLLGARWEEVF